MIPSEESVYSTACMFSHRPDLRCAEPKFYLCRSCGTLGVEFCGAAPSYLPCPCGESRSLLKPSADFEPDSSHRITYVIFGGAEHNAMRVWVGEGRHPMTREHHIRWIYLCTYEGGQFKFLQPGEKAVVNFAFADGDAYAFCDRTVCEMGRGTCQFQCKRGFLVYAYCSLHGLFQLTL